MEKPIFISGIILSVFVIIYFILVYFQEKLRIKYIHKEVFIAFVYVTGILLAPVVWYNEPLIYQHFLLFGILMLLVWTESVIISYYDFKEDKNDQLNSFTTTYGPERTRTNVISVQLILAVILFLSLLVCDVKVMLGAVIIESFMNFILLVIIYFHETFAKNNLFRWIGETVFMLPVLILFF
jgi:4-hydroxybenzoate polyprenyltransferase